MACPNYVDQDAQQKCTNSSKRHYAGVSPSTSGRDLPETSLFSHQSVEERGPNVTYVRYVTGKDGPSKAARTAPEDRLSPSVLMRRIRDKRYRGQVLRNRTRTPYRTRGG